MVKQLLDVDLLREMQKDNLWWKNGEIPEDKDKPFHRSDFYMYLKELNSRGIRIIIGPRRVGKTILFHQLIKYLIKEKKVTPKNIIYLDLAKPYFSFDIMGINPCLKTYQENILKTDFENVEKGKLIYIFIDEIQKEKNWTTILEAFRSRNLPLLFMVTGSSAPEIKKNTDESLVGRAKETNMLHLKFRDIVRKELGYNEEKLKEVKNIDLIFEKAIEEKKIKLFYDYLIKELFTDPLTHDFEIKVKNILTKYFLRGGYPEFYEEKNNSTWYSISKTMRDDYFQRIISRDVVELFNINKPEIIRKLYTLIGLDTSNIVNFSKYTEIIETKQETLKEYFTHLEKTFLVSSSEKYYKKNRPKNTRKKVYVTDIGMRNAVLGLNEEEISENLGAIAETVAHNHCKRLKYRLHPTNEFNLDYWIYNGGEVDIILDLKKIIIPIEIKYREKIRSEDMQGLKDFIKTFNSKKIQFGIILTKNDLFLEDSILGVPLWLFLLIC